MAAISTPTSAASWRPDLNTFAPSEVVPDALILTTATVAGRVEGDSPLMCVAYVDDDTAQFTAEGAVIPEGDPALSEVLIATAKITQLLRVTQEQFDQDGTADELSASVARAIVKKANSAYLTQVAPTSPAVAPPAGLLNIAGLTEGGEVDTSLDALIDLIAELEGNGATPSHIVLDPIGWARLRKIKTATGAATSLLGAGVTDSERRLLDLPVLVTSAMTAGSGVVIDSAATIAAAGPIQVAQSTDAYFASDSIGLRATWRIGWNVVKPERLGTFTVSAA